MDRRRRRRTGRHRSRARRSWIGSTAITASTARARRRRPMARSIAQRLLAKLNAAAANLAEDDSEPRFRRMRPGGPAVAGVERAADPAHRRSLAARARRARARAGDDERQECEQIFYDWNLWARPDQEPPPGDWIVWLILAGRGAGKTRAGAEAVRRWSRTFPDRQPDRPDRRRRARRDGARRIGHSQLLPRRRAAALPRLGRTARLAERRGEPALLGRGAGPAARQAAHEAVVRRTRRVAPARGLRSGDVRPETRRRSRR